MKQNKGFVYLGFVIPVIFWMTTILCGSMLENYDHLTNLVSELGAIGTKTQYIFTIGLVLSSILSMLFVFGLFRTAREVGLSTIPILLILTFSISIFGAAIFPLPLELHRILGSPSMFLPLSPLLALILWEKDKIAHIKLFSGIIFFLMILGFMIYSPEILGEYFGLKQRFFHISWTLWFVYLSHSFIKLNVIKK